MPCEDETGMSPHQTLIVSPCSKRPFLLVDLSRHVTLRLVMTHGSKKVITGDHSAGSMYACNHILALSGELSILILIPIFVCLPFSVTRKGDALDSTLC